MGNLSNFPEFREMQERWYQEQIWEYEQEMKEEAEEEIEEKNKKIHNISFLVDKKNKLIHNIGMRINKLFQYLFSGRRK